MSVLFFRLAGVPQDEADDVRELLASHDIAFFETSAGNWGVSMPAIWLYRAADLAIAQPLMDDYQKNRAIQQRSLYLQAKLNGSHRGFFRQAAAKPVHFVGYCLALGLVAYASVKWVFELGLSP